MAYVPPGKEYYVSKTKARIAHLERQLLPHRMDDPALRPTVTHVGVGSPTSRASSSRNLKGSFDQPEPFWRDVRRSP